MSPSRELVAYLDRELPSPVAAPRHHGTHVAAPGAGAVPLAAARVGPMVAVPAVPPAALPALPHPVPGLSALHAHGVRKQSRRSSTRVFAISVGALVGVGVFVIVVLALAFVLAAVAHAGNVPARRSARHRARPAVVIAEDSSADASVDAPETASRPADDLLDAWCAPQASLALPPRRPTAQPIRARTAPPTPPDSRGWPVLAAVLGTLALVGATVTVDVSRGRARRRVAADRLRRIGWASRTGGRKYNEDRAAAFALGVFDVIVCADGLGGHAGGARAASLVVESSERHLRAALPAIATHHIDLLEDAVRGAFARASEALSREERALGFGSLGIDGLRSTLIIAVATPDVYVIGAQGDGGALVRRADGALVALMSPAKAGAQNILAASLGPVSDGTLEMRREPRKPGDLLVVTTDGVSDRVTDAFYGAFANIVAAAPTVEGAIHDTLVELEQDAAFDDNMTLAALVTAAP